MIGALRGIADTPVTNPLILMVGGVGYRVAVPENILKNIHRDAPITLFTHTYVRDDALNLYGFLTREELTLFELLLSVSGIGPKTSLTIVDRGVIAVRSAIATADVSFFTTIPRLGKKNAQKIIIELKTKLGSIEELDLAADERGETKDILEALESMGFEKKEALTAIKQIKTDDTSVEERLRQALKYLRKR
ncbi:Holliday junction branch migration protein RuvA [Candidatus Gottesmanbacteria bacterium]|nr:Holliday junction branch migration protein RuvA [Candidatus Gottesmanbacteria bacterium]MBI3560009.1 Holliday junction branch migration protein RuvA [Candidatus Gottesmanbacteria bacterium]